MSTEPSAEGYFLDKPVYMYQYVRNPYNPTQVAYRHWQAQYNWVKLKDDIYVWEKLRSAMQRDSHPSLALVTKRVGDLYFNLGKYLFGRGKQQSVLNHLWRGLWLTREGWAYKLIFLAAATFLPGQQCRALKTHLRVAFQKAKGRITTIILLWE